MKKNNIKGYTILGIIFILVNVIAFTLPFEKTTTFWVAYIFTIFAFIVQIGVWKTTFGRENALKNKFLGFSIIHISIVYVVIQLIVFAVFIFIPILPVWGALIVCVIVAGVFVTCLIASNVGGNEIEGLEAKVQKKIFYIKELQVDVELLIDNEVDTTTKRALTQLAEKIRYSDPMSNEQLSDLEIRISAKLEELKKATDKAELITELNSLLDERNKKCKILK